MKRTSKIGIIMSLLILSVLTLGSHASSHDPTTQKAHYGFTISTDADHAVQAIAAIYTVDVLAPISQIITDAEKPVNPITVKSVPIAVRHEYLTYSKGIGLNKRIADNHILNHLTQAHGITNVKRMIYCRSFDCMWS